LLADAFKEYPGVTSAWIMLFAGCLWQLDPHSSPFPRRRNKLMDDHGIPSAKRCGNAFLLE
jgi:hypothetical protein